MCRKTAQKNEDESKFLHYMDKGLKYDAGKVYVTVKHDAGKVYVTVKLVNYFLSSERIT